MDEKEKIECDNCGEQFISVTENTTCPDCIHEGHCEDEGYQDAEMD